jgi:hypothetical protein
MESSPVATVLSHDGERLANDLQAACLQGTAERAGADLGGVHVDGAIQ